MGAAPPQQKQFAQEQGHAGAHQPIAGGGMGLKADAIPHDSSSTIISLVSKPEALVRVGVLFSGGKDSTYAAWLASNEEELACLITLLPKSQMSYMFHFPNLRWTGLQAVASGVPQLTRATEGVKEEELDDLRSVVEEASQRFGIEAVYTGALASEYQKARVEKVCQALGLDCVSPLWHVDPESHLRRLVREGFSVVVVSVSALGLDQTWLGRTLDEPLIDKLAVLGRKYKFHVALEGGEGETFVTDCPLFKARVAIDESEAHWSGDAGHLEIKRAHLVPKA